MSSNEAMPDESSGEKLRLEILRLVATRPLGAGAIAAALGRKRQVVSYHLQVLLDAGRVTLEVSGATRTYARAAGTAPVETTGPRPSGPRVRVFLAATAMLPQGVPPDLEAGSRAAILELASRGIPGWTAAEVGALKQALRSIPEAAGGDIVVARGGVIFRTLLAEDL